MSDVDDMLTAAVNRIANSVSSFDDGIDKMREHINKTIYEADKLARSTDIGISKVLPISNSRHEWRVVIGCGLTAPMFNLCDEEGYEYITIDSVISKKSTRSKEVIVGLFKTLPEVLKELELRATEKLREVSSLLKSI